MVKNIILFAIQIVTAPSIACQNILFSPEIFFPITEVFIVMDKLHTMLRILYQEIFI